MMAAKVFIGTAPLNNRERPCQPELLRRLLLICEQIRDYEAAAGYLRALLRFIPNDQSLLAKRHQYMGLGFW